MKKPNIKIDETCRQFRAEIAALAGLLGGVADGYAIHLPNGMIISASTEFSCGLVFSLHDRVEFDYGNPPVKCSVLTQIGFRSPMKQTSRGKEIPDRSKVSIDHMCKVPWSSSVLAVREYLRDVFIPDMERRHGERHALAIAEEIKRIERLNFASAAAAALNLTQNPHDRESYSTSGQEIVVTFASGAREVRVRTASIAAEDFFELVPLLGEMIEQISRIKTDAAERRKLAAAGA